MRIEFTSISLICLSSLLYLWVVDNKTFFKRKETLYQSLYLIVLFFLSLIQAYGFLSYAFFPFFIVRFLILSKRFDSWLISGVSLIWKFTILVIIQLLTFDLPRLLFSINFFSSIPVTTLLVISQIVLCLFLCGITSHFINRLNMIEIFSSIKKRYRVASLLVLLFFMVTFSLYFFGIQKNSLSILLLSSILLCLSGILFSSLFYFIVKTYKQAKEYEILSLSLSKITKKYENISDFRHDYNGILLSLSGYIDSGDLKNAQRYIHSIIDYSSGIFIPEYYTQLSKISLMPIKSVLASYGEKAINKDIAFILKVPTTINCIKMDVIDFIRCLTVLLDNAFESVVGQKKNVIQVTLENHNDYFSLTIKNPDPSSVPLEKLMEKGYSTKKKHKGKGLSNIAKICDEYNGVDYTIQRLSNTFVASLIIEN
ncbi:sensor histidine kinase [Candidatus Enterococcus murrayae]|uniref:GHKL domain-containing protein n=1 Tax=Candidatus Enterococcus murrayae TaxID=2815321 RepID=A0ABS3HR52_9ENTE|nr:GHKL domain-containing protein [Enterococcus sp. MJM16]MBO0455058.1 GHKL domain-containing protein [Enterococcus sp. MJM16]